MSRDNVAYLREGTPQVYLSPFYAGHGARETQRDKSRMDCQKQIFFIRIKIFGIVASTSLV